MVLNFFAGVGYLARGFARFAKDPAVMWLGAVPALIVGILYAAGILVFAINLDAIVSAVTGFAHGNPFEPLVRITAGLALAALATVVLVFSFAALTLAVGGPFYERIWMRVEQSIDEPVAGEEQPRGAFRRGLSNGLRLLALSLLIGVLLFVAGFIPVVGQTVVPVLGAFLGGWVLTLELTGYTFDARGLPLRERRRSLGAHRARTLGFGVATYLLFLVPFAAIVVMPAAVAGATLLAHDAMREPSAMRGARSGSG